MAEEPTKPIMPQRADPRTIFRQKYRELSTAEAGLHDAIKVTATDLYILIDNVPPSREVAIAKTKLEEAVMWAIKGLTK